MKLSEFRFPERKGNLLLAKEFLGLGSIESFKRRPIPGTSPVEHEIIIRKSRFIRRI